MLDIDVVFGIIVGSAVALVFYFVLWAMCVIAGRSDEISDEYWEEYCERENERMQEKAQKSYEKYRERFAKDYHLTVEKAIEYQAVQNYKEYLEEQYKEYGVKICEKVGD